MGRALTALALIALSAALFLLPQPDAVRAAAQQCGTLLQLAPPKPLGPFPVPPPLVRSVLEGPAVTHHDARSATLHLWGVRVASPGGESDDLTVHAHARRSLVRALREEAARDGLALAVDGEEQPTGTARDVGANFLLVVDGERLALQYTHAGGTDLRVERLGWRPPARSSVFPALAAILIALALRRPLLGLLAGLWFAAALLRAAAGSGTFGAVALAPFDVARGLFGAQWAQPQHLATLASLALLLAMLSVIGAIGGLRALSAALARFVRGARAAQLATWLACATGVFEGGAHGLVAGAALRPLADRFRLSREKLAYLVDTTSGAVASLSLLSTWAAWELATLSPHLPSAGLAPEHGRALLLETLPYRFYSLFALLLALWVALSGRDWGPMLAAERRARTTGRSVGQAARPLFGDAALAAESAFAASAWRAVLPLAVCAAVFVEELVRSREAALPASALDGAQRALLLGASAGFAVAALLAVAAGSAGAVLRAPARTLRALVAPAALLVCAWSLAQAAERLGAAAYLTDLLSGKLAPDVLPCLVLLVAAALSLATGSALGSLALLLPLVAALSYSLGERGSLGPHGTLVVSLAAALEGALFGRHASPLADTTLLASTAAGCDHVEHVRTQFPYALAAFAAALVLGYFPALFLGWSPWLSLGAGAAALLMLLVVFGRKDGAPRAR